MEENVDDPNKSHNVPTINIWFASEAHKALIICKYPHKMYRMISWSIDNDTIVKGQWLTKKKIDFKRCVLQNDGEFFRYVMIEPPYNICLIISKPPYFTALGIEKNLDMREAPKIKDTRAMSYLNNAAMDHRKRNITTKGGCIYINGELFQDFSKDTFECIKPPNLYAT